MAQPARAKGLPDLICRECPFSHPHPTSSHFFGLKPVASRYNGALGFGLTEAGDAEYHSSRTFHGLLRRPNRLRRLATAFHEVAEYVVEVYVEEPEP